MIVKHLATIRDQDFQPGTDTADTSSYKTRAAARAVLLDADGSTYLLNVSKHGYHKLPGGGIDDGETIRAAVARELMEEVGCEARLVAELGQVVEYRDFAKLRQTSYCFLAQQTGEQVGSTLEASELAEGMIEAKVSNIDAAIQVLESDKPDNLEGRFIRRRDLIFLRAAKSSR